MAKKSFEWRSPMVLDPLRRRGETPMVAANARFHACWGIPICERLPVNHLLVNHLLVNHYIDAAGAALHKHPGVQLAPVYL
jgi:hypothetical protein